MSSSEKYNQDKEFAARAIELINAEKIQILLPNNFWNSTLTNLVNLTNGPYYGNIGKKLVLKYNLIFLAYLILSVIASPYAWYITSFCVLVALYVINKFRTKSLRKCIQTVALDNPHGFIDAWNRQLFSLKSEYEDKIYISGVDDWRELVRAINKG